MATTWVQVHGRFRNDDGSESAATWKAAVDTNISTSDLLSGDFLFRLRINVRQTGTTGATFSGRLYYSLNGGAYAQINASGTPVVALDSANLTDDAATTQQISAGTFIAGKVDDVNAQTGSTASMAQNRDTEMEFNLKAVASALADGNTIDFQIRRGTVALTTYTVTPRLTVIKSPPPPLSGPATDDFNRTDNASLGSNWATPTGENALRISSNQAAGNAALGAGAAYWSANSFDDDQYSKCLPTGLAAGGRYECAGVRMGGPNGRGYYAKTDGTNSWLVYRDASGSDTNLLTLTGTGFDGSTDLLEVQAIGTTIRFFKNGAQVGTDATDANIASGSAGIKETPDNNTSIDSWEGGNISSGYTLTMDAGLFSLSGQNANLKADWKLALSAGSFALSGQNISLRHGYTVAASPGSFSLAGQSMNLRAARKLAMSAGSFSLAAQNINLKASRKLSLDFGAFTLAGQSISLKAARKLALSFGVFQFTGENATLAVARKLSLSTGIFVLTGIDIDLIRTGGGTTYTLAMSAGLFTLSGQSISLKTDRRLTASHGLFNLAGQDAILRYARRLSLSPGIFTLTGEDIGLRIARRLALDHGLFILAGQDTNLHADRILHMLHGEFLLIGQDIFVYAGRPPFLKLGNISVSVPEGEDFSVITSGISKVGFKVNALN